jgi:hypothetical protein
VANAIVECGIAELQQCETVVTVRITSNVVLNTDLRWGLGRMGNTTIL